MHINQTIFTLPSWSLYDYQFRDFLSNQTLLCPIRSHWIHFEEFFFTSIGLFITFILLIKIHWTEIRFHDYYALFRCYMISLALILLFLTTFLFNINANETTCRYEQILIQYAATILLTTVFLISLMRIVKINPIRLTLFIFIISLILQTFLTSIWLYLMNKNSYTYHRRTCFHRIQIDLCLHAQQPLLFSIFFLPGIFLLTAWNVYRFTKPFAVAQLLEAIISSIGLLMSGSMWYMNLIFSNYPQMPYRYVAYVFLLTYILPRVWISELERSRITVEEVKPLLHDEVKFHNDNCTIRFNDDDDDDEEEIDIAFSSSSSPPSDQNSMHHSKTKSIIRTTDMSPGEIFSSILDKYDPKSGGCL